MKIGIITDIHHGKPSLTKRGDAALALMSKFADFVRMEKPDLVLDLGDRITDADHATDVQLVGEVADAFSEIDVPIYHVCGNHDLNHLSAEENAELIGQTMDSKLLDVGAWQIAVWNPDAKLYRTPNKKGFHLPESDFLWLAHQMSTAEKPTLVVSHVPVSGHDTTGNYYFHHYPTYATYPQHTRVRLAMESARVPIVSLAGHVHWNTVTQIGGVVHLTQQSLTESFTTQGEPAEAWGVISLGERVTWDVFGKDPLHLSFVPVKHRWTPPRRPR